MKIFLLDLWNDLREKRLWPVAVVLLASLVAVPVLLARPAEEPSAPPQPSGAVSKASKESDLEQLAKVELADEEPGDGSTLGVFDPENPFTPPKAAVKNESDQAPSAEAGPDSSESPQNPEPAKTEDGAAGGGGSGGGDAGGTTGGTGGGTGGGDGGTPPPITVAYKYVADVTFSSNGRVRRVKGLEKLDILPNEASPLLIFMGVTENAGNAVFLVDSTLEAAGEGRCRPSASNCAFLYLGAGSEHEFTNDDGDSYTLRVDEIRRVKLGASASRNHGVGRKARASIAAPGARRVAHPSIADLVTVSSATPPDSNRDQDHR